MYIFLAANLQAGVMTSTEADLFLPAPANASVGDRNRALTSLGDVLLDPL